VKLADEHWGVIGVKFKQTSCDKLGPIEGSDSSSGNNEGKSDNSNNSSQGNNQDSSNKDHNPLREFKGWDDSWIKQRVSSWDHLKDHEFEKHWEDLTSDTWASKFKQEKPSWVK
jgi:hypothetical protein